MTSSGELSSLKNRLVHPGSLVTDLNGLERYFTDATHYSRRPLAVLMAECTEDVAAAVKFCRENGVAVTPRGAGTGLSGGCVPSPNALVLSTERLDTIQLFPAEKIAVCGPGVITKDLQDQAAHLGLTYPPDPASLAECTLGGNIAENAGGLRCKRFGVTRDYVLGLEAVTAEGEIIQTGVLNEARGFNLTDIIIGSEGTLAVVTSMVLRLIDLPERGHTLLAAFDDPRQAARAVSAINTSGMIPTVMEYVDGDSVDLANEYDRTEGIDRAAAVLLIETSDLAPDQQAATVRKICTDCRATYIRVESDSEKAESLWRIRRNISKAAEEFSVVKVSEDVAVPNSRFPELVEFVAQLNRENDIRINSYGHAGDGNLHVNFLSATGSESDIRDIERAVQTLMKTTLALGGTLTGEHGIGLAKKKQLLEEFDPATLRFMVTFGHVFDPTNILNPDKVFDSLK